MHYPEFCSLTCYCGGEIVWFGELAFIVKRDRMIVGEQPDISDNWKVFIRIKHADQETQTKDHS